MSISKAALAETTGSDLRLAIGRIARALRQAHSVGDLTLSAASVIARLDRLGPATPSALAAGESVRPQAMASTLTALEDSGYIERGPDPADGRKVIVTLTDAGRDARRSRKSESAQRLQATLVETFTVTDLGRIRDVVPLLEKLGEALGGDNEQ